MVRLPVSIPYHFPQKVPNLDLVFLSKKHLCLYLLNLCSSSKQTYQIHAQIHISGLHQDPYLLSQLVYSYALSSQKNLNFARTLVRHSQNSPPSWNIVIRGYSSSESAEKSIRVFHEMRRRGIRPNKLTFPFLIKACSTVGAFGEGRQVQGQVIKYGLDEDVYVQNNLINFYGSCKKILDAEKVFDEMSVRTVVSWNSVLTACVENLWLQDAIEYFVGMGHDGFEPDETTMVVMLSACAELGNLSMGKWVHSQLILRGMVLNCQLGTALVDMYAKSGAVNYARLIFDKMGERNVWTWSAMILGLAQHGFDHGALNLFTLMLESSSICPNYVTFLGVLCACSHAGRVDDGYKYFHDMEHIHGIKPMMIHYGAMVDILGRSGRLSEAYSFIHSMPIEPDPILWRTLLSACTIHGVDDTEGVGDKVRKRLLQLEPRRCGNFVIVANMYAEAGMWEKAANLRRTMRDGGLKKMAGESWVEIGGSTYGFFSGYDSKADLRAVYQLLEIMNLHIMMVE